MSTPKSGDTPATLQEMQQAAMILRGLLRGLDDLGMMNDPRHMDVCMGMIQAGVPIAEKLAEDLEELASASDAEKRLWGELSQT